MKLPEKVVYQMMLSMIKKKLGNEEQKEDEKMWEIVNAASFFYLNQAKKGEKYILPYRFSAVLVKEKEKWLFQ